jgi:hypothetical protein
MQRPKSIAHQYSRRSSPNNNTNNNTNNNIHRHSNSSDSNSNTSSNTMKSTNNNPSASVLADRSNWQVKDDALKDVPSFYPLEKSTKFVSDKPSHIANRISDCCRVMSVQASFDNDLATADLKTSEHVEIHITLWKSSPSNDTTNSRTPVTIVEAQRRKGDAVTFYKYCHSLLSAADGTFSYDEYAQTDREEEVKIAKQEILIQGIKEQRREKSSNHQNLKNGDSDETNGNPYLAEGESSLLALEIAASLLKKDRMDARQLGMETLCLLTDPAKSGIETALLASKVVLFGAVDAGNELLLEDDDYMPAEDLGVREAILSLVQFGRLGEHIDFEEEEDAGANLHAEEKEFNALLHNLALAVLANALDVLEQHGNEMARVGSNTNPDASNVAVARAAATEEMPSTNTNAFLEETKEISKRELLSTLLNVLGRAESKPHDACLSAQCLRSLFQASKKAKRKARDLNAKQIVNTALDVGRRSHVKLENVTKKIILELQKTDDMDDANVNESNINNSNQEQDSEDESTHSE